MKPWIDELNRLLTAEQVSAEPDVLEAHAGDKWYASSMPECVVFPLCTDDVVAVMQTASKHGVPVTTRGGGAGYVGSCVPVRGGIVLAMEKMNRIIELAYEDGVAVVQPGVITGELQREVAQQGWFYPPDPASANESTIGGNIATNAGGPRCLKYGVTRAYVLGLEVVLADGRVLKCGGRTHKFKAGFDLVGLFVGSEGMLGVVTEATLRLIPHPESRVALSAGFAEFSQAAEAVQRILQAGHLPAAMEITDGFTLNAARAYLGAGVLPEASQGHIIVELDGRKAGLEAEAGQVEELLRRLNALDVRVAHTDEEVEAIWQLRREFSYSLKATGMTKLNEDIVIPRSKLVDLVNFCESMQEDSGIAVACFGHSGDGNIHTNVMVDNYADPVQKQRADACVDRLFLWVMGHGGAITGEHGIGLAKVPWFPAAVGQVGLSVHQSLKDALDPEHILNPGKMGLN